MSAQSRSDLKSTAPTCVSRNAMNSFGAKDLTALAAKLSPAGPSVREALISTAPRGEGRTSEGCQDDLASVEGVTVALRRACDRPEVVSRAPRPLLAGAHRDLREPLTAMLRLNNDWNVRGTDMVPVRIIERQRQALEVMADLIDSFLTIAEPEMPQPPAPLTHLASRSADGKLREASATPEPRAEEWSAEWSMIPAVDSPKVPVAVGPAPRVRRVLLVNEDRGVLGALRIYLLCAGYRVFAAASPDEALDRAWMARMATSLIDIIIVNSDFAGDDNGLAVIDKTRRLLGYNVPAVLLTTQTSIMIGKAALATAVYLLRNPVNLDELSTLIGEVLKSSGRRFCPAQLRTTRAKLGHDEPNPRSPADGLLKSHRRILTRTVTSRGRPIRNEYLIVQGGKLAGAGAHSYSAGDATRGSEEAARFKTTKGAGEPTRRRGENS
jgi:DNA-binding response OmpR family regulator